MEQAVTLQQQWDIWLCAYFNKKPDRRVYFALNEFAFRMKMTEEELFAAKLKRFPEGFNARHCSVRRFICGFIIGGADIIYGEGNPIQKAAKLSRCVSSAVPIDAKRVREESRDKGKTRRDFNIRNDEYKLGAKQREAHARRNWNACKP
jgi:hypothetical protein